MPGMAALRGKGRSTVPGSAVLAAALLGALSVNAAAADADDDAQSRWFEWRWFRIEAILFQRPAPNLLPARPKLLATMRYPRTAVTLAPDESAASSATDLPPFAPRLAVAEAAPFFVSNLLPPLWFTGDCGLERWPAGGALDPCLESQHVDLEQRFPDDPSASWPVETLSPSADDSVVDAADESKPRQAALDALTAAIAEYEEQLRQTSYVWTPELADLRAPLARLRRRFDVLAAGAWHQPLPPRDQPQPLLVQAGTADASRRFPLEGWLAVTIGRYLHLEARLQVVLPGGGLAVLAERRRMRSNELHYLDHPAIGLLAQARPLQAPAELRQQISAFEGS